MRYGFIGLGNLGDNLAGSLLRKGFDLTVTDLDRAEAPQPLIASAARNGPTSPQAVAAQVDAVITCLPSPAVSERVLPARASWRARRPGSTWIEMSTNDRTRSCASPRWRAEQGVATLEAPVTGGVHLRRGRRNHRHRRRRRAICSRAIARRSRRWAARFSTSVRSARRR